MPSLIRGGVGGAVRLAAAAQCGAARAAVYRERVPPAGVFARNMACNKQITLETMNQNLVKLEYAVRGPLVIRALEIEKELEKGADKPFKSVIKANIGDAHAVGQVPITFIRQVLACITYPELINTGDFPSDVKERAKSILAGCGGGSVGAYTASQGIEIIRRHAAEYIERRDCIPARWQDICLSAGASDSIKNVLKSMVQKVDGKVPGVMIPIPQYPLYTATLAEFGMEPVSYYLNEDSNWGLDVEELERSVQEAGCRGVNVRAIVIINPGNPTGQVLTAGNIKDIMKFSEKHKLCVMADEVYQDNVYAKGSEFYSFKKIATEMGSPYSDVEMASFMSVSKGYMGECGIRGGYVELRNFDPAVQAHLYKAISAMLCPTSLGQAVMDCVVKPPAPGEPSYDLWCKEKTDVLSSLAMRAEMVEKTFNSMQGFKCNVVQGAMYAFPRIELPPKAIEAAKKAGQAPDVYYAFRLLETTGICIVPGTGFGQKPGTYHFRTTILPSRERLQLMLDSFQNFHKQFTAEHA